MWVALVQKGKCDGVSANCAKLGVKSPCRIRFFLAEYCIGSVALM